MPADPAVELREQLEEAQSEAFVVCVTCDAFEAGVEIGYVIDVGAELLLLLRISEEIRFNGFAVLRVRDITEVDAPYEHADFVEAALRRREECASSAPEVDLDSFEAVLRTAGKLFPVVTVHRDEVEPESCEIGKVVRVSSESVSLLEIGPDADWARQPTQYAVSEITKLEFGGGYEEALVLVGGEPPAAPHLKSVS